MLVPGCKIGLSGNTGSGKTYFCSHNLKQVAEEIGAKLHYVCNRTALKVEVANMQVFDHVYCYQSMNKEDFFEDTTSKQVTRIYVIDECHFTLDDSSFNYEIDDKLEWILNLKNSVVIFMSATGDHLFRYLKNLNKLDYYFQISYSYDYVDRVFLYHSQSDRNAEIDYLMQNTNDKMLLFVSSALSGWKLYQKLVDKYGTDQVKFRCSPNINTNRNTNTDILAAVEAKVYVSEHYYTEDNKGYLVPKDTEFLIRRDGSLNCRILIATRSIDNGVNILDPDLRHVFGEIISITSLKQALGRCRNVGQSVNFYIYCRTKKLIENQFLKHNQLKLDFMRQVENQEGYLEQLIYCVLNEDYSQFEQLGMDEDQIRTMIKVFSQNKGISRLSYINALLEINDLQYAVENSYENLIKYQMFKPGEIQEHKWGKLNEYQQYRTRYLKDKEKKDYLNSLLDRELTRSELKAIAQQFQLWNDKRHLYNLEQVINWLLEQGYQVKIIEPKYKNHGKKYIIEKLGNKRN